MSPTSVDIEPGGDVNVDVSVEVPYDVIVVEQDVPGVIEISAPIPGDTGPGGPSAYEVAVEEGFVGTEAEWLDSLKSGAVLPLAFHAPAALTAGDLSAVYIVPWPIIATTVHSVLTSGTALINVLVNGAPFGSPVSVSTSLSQSPTGQSQILDTGDTVGIRILSTTSGMNLSVTITGITQ